jgi:hypothetical protein
MARMTAGDWKSDTVRGARLLANAQAKQRDRQAKKSSAQKAATFKDIGIVPVWSEFKELKQLGFDKLVETRTRIKDEIAFRTEKLKELDDEISAAMAVSGAEKVLWEDRPVQIVHSKSGDKIVAEKLLMAGVSADVIAASTEPGKPYSYLLVGKAK